ncbi:MAG: hypothetical protein NTU53_23025 [Planctomycetota bacterium]|nr:hypothetical protein [Planctomycetota bacterium]
MSKHLPPSPTDNGGRDDLGRFGPHNSFGVGNRRLNQRVQQIRAALLEAVSADDVRAATRMMVKLAVAGDRAAFAELLDRTIGKPVASDLLQRIERLEQLLDNPESE